MLSHQKSQSKVTKRVKLKERVVLGHVRYGLYRSNLSSSAIVVFVVICRGFVTWREMWRSIVSQSSYIVVFCSFEVLSGSVTVTASGFSQEVKQQLQ